MEERMLDSKLTYEPPVRASSVLLFDRAMRLQAIKSDIVRAAQDLNRLSDQDLAELGINRSDVEAVIAQYI
jgi:uncharacterized protein YjiS (DUF1127 family)